MAPGVRSTINTKSKKAAAEPNSPSGDWKVKILLDTKTRMDFPNAPTNVEVKCEADRVPFRDVAWLITEATSKFGVPVVGLRRMKGGADLESGDALTTLSSGESVVCFNIQLSISLQKKKINHFPSIYNTSIYIYLITSS
jgi:hypothetical protein